MKAFEPIRITGIIEQNVSIPRNDGTRGSALYDIPFQLSSVAPAEWSEYFPHAWDHPSSCTSVHRRGICQVSGDVVWLRGTTLEEVAKYHKVTLQLALDETNKKYSKWLANRQAEAKRLLEEQAAYARHVSEAIKGIKFD